MKKLLDLFGLLYVATFVSVISAIAQEQPRVLSVNAPIERELAGGQRHTYTVNLKPGQIAQVIAAQRGVDVVVAVISPDGKRLFEVDSPSGSRGDETANIVATQAGAYRVEISTKAKS